ncbi:Hypothetical protein, putative [Bodo saltans]|uniref:Glycosyltransferase 61 catalytic domain-containing protein n=1 Tax=Bodo saltans TaxID=75058 RepID=A0A0S4JWW7_BODSA|nr:Hypothetical protein, putative [Bodo saltans]|eukprot:CUG93081.1 Hypothetical protein, putative [Bodo saltans]
MTSNDEVQTSSAPPRRHISRAAAILILTCLCALGWWQSRGVGLAATESYVFTQSGTPSHSNHSLEGEPTVPPPYQTEVALPHTVPSSMRLTENALRASDVHEEPVFHTKVTLDDDGRVAPERLIRRIAHEQTTSAFARQLATEFQTSARPHDIFCASQQNSRPTSLRTNASSCTKTTWVKLRDCVTVLDGVRVDPVNVVELSRPQPLWMPLCSVVSRLPIDLRFAEADSSHKVSNTCGGEAVSITILERPQHAMQFLFSLFGAVAMQSSFGFDPNTDVAVVSIISYGEFATWEDLWRWDKYPHMELLQLLSKRGVAVVGQRHAIKDLDVISPTSRSPHHASSFMRGRASSRSVVHLTGPWIKWNVSGQGPPALPCAAKTALFGGLPPRVMHYKKRETHRHAIHPWHFTMFRWRALEHFGIAEVLDPRERYAIVVTRLKQKRRLILNHDTLVKTVASVGVGYRPVVVDWEGMKLEDQLRLALNANAIIGVHGNGHVWDCLMPSGGLMIEFSSDVQKKNEVAAGHNRRNVGNLAGLCPIESYSFRSKSVQNAFSLEAARKNIWKEVDIELSHEDLDAVKKALTQHQATLIR